MNDGTQPPDPDDALYVGLSPIQQRAMMEDLAKLRLHNVVLMRRKERYDLARAAHEKGFSSGFLVAAAICCSAWAILDFFR